MQALLGMALGTAGMDARRRRRHLAGAKAAKPDTGWGVVMASDSAVEIHVAGTGQRVVRSEL